MHAPRGGRPERPERDDREMDDREAPERAPRGARGVGAMARDLSRSMSRSVQALGRSFSRAIREAGTYEPRGVRPAPLPPELMEEMAQQPYRRSRARVVARKWRLKRIGPNPIVMAVVVMLLLVAVVVVLGIGGAGGIYAVSYYQSHQTQIQQIYNLRNTQGVQIFDRNGNQLYVARSDQNGINIYTGLSNISDKVQKATIDTEDVTFWTNNGVDLYRTIGAAVADLKSGQNDQGASTITQQVVKNIVAKDNAKTYQRKVNEAILAYGLTLNYTKAQILEMYLNTIDYGDQNTGIEAAARNYFGIQPIPDPNNPKAQIMANQQLDWWQAVILAGLPNAPSYYLPIQYSCSAAPCDDSKWANPCLNNPHDATCNPNPNYDSTVGTGDGHEWLVYRRSLIVLGNLYRYQDITLDQENVAIQKIHDCLVSQCMGHWLAYQTAGANGSTGSNSAGSNTNVVPEKAPWFVDYIIQELATDFGVTDPEHTALKVYTTLDENYEAYAEHTVQYYVADQHYIRWPLYAPKGCTTCLVPSLGDYANGHDGATVAIDPRTGDILAMVGSVNYTDTNPQVAGQVNVVTANRSMGSATKGIVYATAFQKGWNPGIMLQDMPVCWPDPALVDDPGKPDDQQPIQDDDAQACVGYYAPHNFDPESFSGNAPIREVLANSLNVPATEAMSFVGSTAVTSQDFISMASRMGISTLTPGRMGVATALGTQEIPLMQLTSAYGTFADGGKHTPVRSILRIEYRWRAALRGAHAEPAAGHQPAGGVYADLSAHRQRGTRGGLQRHEPADQHRLGVRRQDRHLAGHDGTERHHHRRLLALSGGGRVGRQREQR